MRLRRIFLCTLLAGLGGIALGGTAARAQCAWSVVTTNDPGPVASLNGVSVRTPTDAWAVGWYSNGGEFDSERALIMRLTGETWATVAAPGKGSRTLSDVVTIASNDVWAVGTRPAKANRPRSTDKTLAMHFDGTAWSVVPTPNVGEFGSTLSAVDATAPGDVWAVGHSVTKSGRSKALALHYDGTAWSVVPSPTPKRTSRALLGVVAATFRSDAWAVGWTHGGQGEVRPLVQRWDGATWQKVETPEPAGPSRLFDVDKWFGNPLVIVGTEEVTGGTRAFSLRFDGDGWALVPTRPSGSQYESLVAVETRSPSGAWAVGSHGPDGPPHALAQSYSHASESWSLSPAPDVGDDGTYLNDVGSSDRVVWAVGAYANPDAGSFRPGSHTLIERLAC